MTTAVVPAAQRRRFRAPGWLTGYRRSLLPGDIVAGITLWALVVPQSMAYASIAGVPPQFGLYAIPLAVLAYAWFGSSERLYVGPSSTVAALAATVLAPLAAVATDTYVLLSAVLSLVTGVLFLILAALRMGFIARIFARPVLDGFVVGLGVFIAVGQVPKVVGMDSPEGNTVRQFVTIVTSPEQWNAPTVAIGLGSIATLVLFKKYVPRVPGPLVVVVVSLVLVSTLSLGEKGVDLVGEVPRGFALLPWSTLSLDQLSAVVPGAAAVVVVGFAQSLAVAKAYAAREGTVVDADRELLAYGAASIGAGVLQGFPPTGSLASSAAAENAGARSPMTFVVSSGLVVLTILFLTGFFTELPQAVLGAVVIHAVSGMVQPPKIWRLRQIGVPDFWLALFAFLGVVLVGVMAGILIGVGLSMVLLLERLSHPLTAVLGRHEERGFVDLAANPGARPVPGVLVFRVDGPLVFASIDEVLDRLRQAIAEQESAPDLVVFDFGSVYEIDVTAADALSLLVAELRGEGIEMRFAEAHVQVRRYLARLDHADLSGVAAPYPSVEAALAGRGHA